jgi:hypothetical protein
MISLSASEEKIGQVITELLVPPLAQPAFALTLHPGNLDDKAVGVRGASNVIVRFRSIDYESPAVTASCISQINTVNFNILVNNNNLRQHREVYSIAEAIIGKLRGRCDLLIAQLGSPQVGQKPAEIVSFSFTDFDDTKSCNKAEIMLSIKFIDSYTSC